MTRSGLFGETGVKSEFAGFSNYAQALADGSFLASIGRMLLFGIVQVPLMIALCTVLALMLESASAKWPGFFRAAYFLPYGVPGVIATILWSFLYVPGLSPAVRRRRPGGTDTRFPRRKHRPVVHREHRHLELHGLQHAHHRGPAEGDTRRNCMKLRRSTAPPPGASPCSIQLPLIRPALVLTTVFSIIGTLQLFAEAQVLKTVAPAIDSQYTPNLSAYTTAFAYNDYNVAAAQAVLIALAAFTLSFAFLKFTNRKSS